MNTVRGVLKVYLGAFVVVDAGECVELVVQAGDGWG